MNKNTFITILLMITTLCVCIPTYAQELERDNIKHELARMPEQASWTIERWNINDVDFELKEVSKETRNQPAKFELNIQLDKKAKEINPVSRFIKSTKISRNEIIKNKILYKNIFQTFTEKSILNKEYWHIMDFQLKLVDGLKPKSMTANSRFYNSFFDSDFPKLNWLIKTEFFVGEVKIEGEMYLIYQCFFNNKLKDMGFEIYEYKFNMERAGDGNNIDYEKLATLPTIEDLFRDKFSYVAIIDKQTKLPLYYSDCVSIRKYDFKKDYQEFQVPDSIQKYIAWYIENVLPELERRAKKAAN